MKSSHALVLSLLIGLSPMSWANSPAAGKSPVYGYLETATLQGQGRLTFWGFDVYDARYYVADPKGQNGFALEIQYIRAFKGNDARAPPNQADYLWLYPRATQRIHHKTSDWRQRLLLQDDDDVMRSLFHLARY
jgi:hypothetical protein